MVGLLQIKRREGIKKRLPAGGGGRGSACSRRDWALPVMKARRSPPLFTSFCRRASRASAILSLSRSRFFDVDRSGDRWMDLVFPFFSVDFPPALEICLCDECGRLWAVRVGSCVT